MDAGRLLFLVGAVATHAVVGYALVRAFTDADPRLGLVFGTLPDADFWFPAAWGWPWVHRGITHTPLFAVTVVLATYAVARERTAALAAGLAVGSHVVIDSLSPAGIDWAFPLSLLLALPSPIETISSPGLDVHGPAATVLLWTAAIGILAWRTDAVPPRR